VASAAPVGDGDFRPPVAPAAERGLDALNLFVANIQTGFGPFIAVYLTVAGWTQAGIGIALSVGTLTAMASQIPAGAMVDAIESKTRVAVFSLIAFALSALMLAIHPIPLLVYGAEILHGFSSCTLGPAIAAISVGLYGHRALSVRFGRNTRYASIGNGLGAAMMAACGYYVSERAVFFLTAALVVPALFFLKPLAGVRLATVRPAAATEGGRWQGVGRVLKDRRLLIFAGCATLFYLSATAMLPIAGAALTKSAGAAASLMIGASIVLPQIVVASLSSAVARLARRRGRRIALLLGFAMVPLRGVVLALVADPVVVILIQAVDGVAGACWGVLQPLVISDIAGRSGHYTLSLGVVGFAMGIGATLSTTLGGWLADSFGTPTAFGVLTGIGVLAFVLVWLAMPETRAGDA
jgi:MFS family permease